MVSKYLSNMKIYTMIGKVFGITLFSLSKDENIILSILPEIPLHVLHIILLYGAQNNMMQFVHLTFNKRIGKVILYIGNWCLALGRPPLYIYYRNRLKNLIVKIDKINNDLGIYTQDYYKTDFRILFSMIFVILFYVAIQFPDPKIEFVSYKLMLFVFVMITSFDFILLFKILNEMKKQYKFINRKMCGEISFLNVNRLMPIGGANTDNVEKIKIGEKDNFYKNIYTLAELHMKISKCAKETNELWTYSILGILGMFFTFVTMTVHEIAGLFSSQDNYISIFKQSMHVALLFAQMCFLVYSWTSLSFEAHKAKICIHKIWNALPEHEIDLKARHLQLIVVQLANSTPQFTTHGIFDLDFSLILVVIGAISTYVVILIQFEMASAVKGP